MLALWAYSNANHPSVAMDGDVYLIYRYLERRHVIDHLLVLDDTYAEICGIIRCLVSLLDGNIPSLPDK